MGWQELNQAALLAARQSHPERAEELWLEALEQLDRAGIRNENAVLVLDNLARHYVKLGYYERAEECFINLVQLSREASGPRSPAVAKSICDLAKLMVTSGRDQEAADLLREALEIWELSLGREHVEVAHTLRMLADFEKQHGRAPVAEQLLLRAMPIYERHFNNHPEIARLMNELALVYLAQEKYDEAEVLFVRQFEIWRTATNSKRPDIAKSLNDLAAFYHARGQHEKAEKACRKAIDLSAKAMGEHNHEAARAYNTLGICFAARGDVEGAKENFQRAIYTLSNLYGPDHPQIQSIWQNIAQVMARRRK